MTSTRQYKVSRLLQKELGHVFQREGNSIFKGKMITVTEVRITADLGQARVFLSIFRLLRKRYSIKQWENIHSIYGMN